MTSRLKRKLENLGFDTSSGSSKLTENFCLIGTPLPSLEKAKDTGEFQPLWKQEVRDEQGRRRLHGAFTGGFSAGYFNSVGSKEGWAPSTFISSRSSRASQKAAKPEDFMDEEDLAEMRESQKLVDTTEESSHFAGTRTGGLGPGPDDDSLEGVLSNLVPPSNDSAGARLLQKMGWRPGQGVGPRVTYAKLKLQDLQSSAIPADSKSLSEDIDEEASKHLFAPRDIKVIQYRPKDNSHGLGYTSGPGLRQPSDLQNQGSLGPKISAGFGLGALNDADDDDVDVYDTGFNKGSRRRLAYDAGSDEETTSVPRKQVAGGKPVAEQSSNRFHDGRVAPTGFVIAAKPEVEDKWYPLPDIPKGWKPDPHRIWHTATKLQQQENIPPVGHQQAHFGKPLGAAKSADERAAILGEVRLPVAPRSVFDYLSEKDRERLKGIAKSKDLRVPVAGADETMDVDHHPQQPEVNIPTLHPSMAKAALLGFQPFANDPSKQARYTTFLNYYASPGSHPPLARQSRQTAEEFSKELSDFSKSAMIFKPATGAMANRFTSAVIVEGGANVVIGLHQPSSSDNYLTTPNAEEEARKAKELEEKEALDPKKNAAKMEMFGPLTRETTSWQPDKLLCKRFGVKDPYPAGLSTDMNEQSTPNVPGQTTPASGGITTPLQLSEGRTSTQSNSAASDTEAPSKDVPPGRRDIANIGLGEDETQGRDILTYERPSRDIFKAIFASDDEDDSDSDEMDVDVKDAPSLAAPELAEGNPKAEPLPEENDKPVDLATFRPTFTSRSDRIKGKDDKDKPKNKKDKKKKAKAIVSFEESDADGDGGSALSIRPAKEKEKKKRRRDKEDIDKEKEKEKEEKKLRKLVTPTVAGQEEEIWVEKAPPTVAVPSQSDAPADQGHGGRMKASDFM